MRIRVLLINVLLLEVACGGLLWWFSHQEPGYFQIPWDFYTAQVDALSEAQLSRFRERAHDAQLGWDNRPTSQQVATNSVGAEYTVSFDTRGARSSPWSHQATLLSAYGDSHILADEVSDSQTWAVQLSDRLRVGVDNYGVAGYGPDQALLKLERHLQQGRVSPVVLLGMHEENIGRLLGNYRPFYLLRDGNVLGFKPRFQFSAQGLELIPNPLGVVSAREAVLQALEQAARTDFWWQENTRKLSLRPPFSLGAGDLLFTLLDEERLLPHPFKEPPKRFFSSCRYPSRWHDAEAVALVEALVERFVSLAQEYDFTPVLLMLPCMEHVPVPSYLQAVAALRQRFESQGLVLVDMHPVLVAQENFDPTRYRVRPEGGHLSEYGNGLVAEALARVLVGLR